VVAHFQGNQRFEVLTRLGQGGMGAVYQVIDRSRNVRIALKSIGHASGDSLLRFKREFRALQEIRHPNLVELGELFEMDQRWFFTMELIDGADFYTHVREPADVLEASGRALPAADGLSLLGRPLAPSSAGFSEVRLRRGLAGLVSGVAALHARGLLHRDLKPANVLVTNDGRVVLIDFGLVTGAERSGQSTEIQIMGTVAYMSPEQAAEEPSGPASDWYAVGVMLYECLTGQLPIDDSHLRLLVRKQREVPPAPRTLVPEVPADLSELCMDLLQIDPRKRPSVQEIYRRLHVEGPAPDQRPSTSLSVAGLSELFVGRTAERERLLHALAETSAGRQRTINLIGPSGVGKSALLRRFEAELLAADPGALVLHGQCHEYETVPYKALDGVMDALSKWLKTQPGELVKTLLPADTRLIATTFTVLERVSAVRHAHRAARATQHPQEKRFALLSAVRELFRRIAEQRRTVLILEDMQWSDEDSFHLLRELTRTPDAPPLLIVYSRRPGLNEPDGEGRLDPGAGEEIALRPLERADAMELARRIWPGEPGRDIDRVVDQAEGYPFLLEALVQASSSDREAGSHGVEDVLSRLVKGLTRPSRALLEVISLAGFPIMKRSAAEAAGVAPEDLSSELKFLRAARWIRTNGPLVTDLVEPSHDRVRRTVLAQLAAERRAGLHRAIALALEEASAEPDKIAHHYLLGGDRQKAAQGLESAAERALAALAFDHAAALFRQLIDLGGHDAYRERELLIAWGDALASAGRGRAAAQAYQQAIPSCSGAQALDLKRRAAEQYLIGGHFEEGMRACSLFVGAFGIELPATPRRALLELILLRARCALRGHGFKPRLPEQITAEELARIDALWSMARGLGAHDLIRSQVFQTRGLLRALDAGEPFRIARAYSNEYVSNIVQKPQREAEVKQLIERAIALAREIDSPYALGLAYFSRGLGEYAGLCRFAQALDHVAQGLAILRNEARDASWEVAQSHMVTNHCRILMGNWRELRHATRDCQEADARGDLYLGLVLRAQALSFLALVEDRADSAARQAKDAFELQRQAASPVHRFVQEHSELRVLQYCGKVEEALAAAAAHQKGLVDTLLLGAPIIRLMATETALHNALLAVERGLEPKLHLKQAAQVATTLERSGIAAMIPGGRLGRAAIAHAHQQAERTLALLQRAEQGFTDAQREGDAAAVRRRRGQLLGGDEGKALVGAAERWFTEQGVRNIPAICRLLAPGFAGLDE
jgi:serine/threonine protein kinase